MSNMPNVEELRQMISEQLEGKLSGNGLDVDIKQQQGPPKEIDITLPLDSDDTVRLENLILKQHVEALTMQLEDDRRVKSNKTIVKVKDDFQQYLVEKYNVDTNTHKIMVDAKTYNLTISLLDK